MGASSFVKILVFVEMVAFVKRLCEEVTGQLIIELQG
jgi:hypothetical protein